VCSLAAFSSATFAAPTFSTPAPQLVISAQKRAGKERKNVLVMFHSASCSWCRRLDAVMNKPEFKKLFTDSYVIVPLDVDENSAAQERDKLGGAESGLPFYAVVDAKGHKLADSNALRGPNGTQENIGYPDKAEEVAAFDALLRKTAPRMKTSERQSLITYLNRTSPSRTGSADAGQRHRRVAALS